VGLRFSIRSLPLSLSRGPPSGLLLPILGATPDSLVILISGLGSSPEEAREQVSVGLGVLCGSTVMLLSIAWGVSERGVFTSHEVSVGVSCHRRRLLFLSFSSALHLFLF
jgi:hypothetical protein